MFMVVEKRVSGKHTFSHFIVLIVSLTSQRQVDVDRVVTSEILGGVMVSKLVHNAIDVGSIPVLGALFSIFITPTTI